MTPASFATRSFATPSAASLTRLALADTLQPAAPQSPIDLATPESSADSTIDNRAVLAFAKRRVHFAPEVIVAEDARERLGEQIDYVKKRLLAPVVAFLDEAEPALTQALLNHPRLREEDLFNVFQAVLRASPSNAGAVLSAAHARPPDFIHRFEECLARAGSKDDIAALLAAGGPQSDHEALIGSARAHFNAATTVALVAALPQDLQASGARDTVLHFARAGRAVPAELVPPALAGRTDSDALDLMTRINRADFAADVAQWAGTQGRHALAIRALAASSPFARPRTPATIVCPPLAPRQIERMVLDLKRLPAQEQSTSLDEIVSAIVAQPALHRTALARHAVLTAADHLKLAHLRKLACSGIDLDIRDRRGYTSLQRLAWHGYLPSVEALLTAGADVNAGGPLGLTAMHIAAGRGHFAIMERMESAGGDMKQRTHPDAGALPPLEVARALGHRNAMVTMRRFFLSGSDSAPLSEEARLRLEEAVAAVGKR